jgi:NAD(P)-dependent dehydrogenase (short-subunit alcohol dehydrogenase family)
MANRLQDKIMLITGAASGLGREVALLAAAEGACVVVTDRVEKNIAPVVDLIAERGGAAVGHVVDITDEASLEASFEKTLEQYGRVDIVHANAGVGVPGMGKTPFEDITVDEWNATNNVNLLGTFLTIKHGVRAMKRTETKGSIVVTSSAAAFVAYPGQGPYVAGKAGVNGLVRTAAWEFGKYGIRVNAICPTHGMSANFGSNPDAPVSGLSWSEARGNWSEKDAVMPLKLPFPPSLSHNAWPAIFLASDESQYMSGVCIPTGDGGQLARVSIPFEESWTMADQVAAVNS